MIPDTPVPKKKKRDKVRSAWISFVGRIVAHVIGAIASVVLGLMVLNNYSNREPSTAAPVASDLAQHRSARSSGELAIAVLPLQNYSADSRHAFFADGMTEALITDLAHIHGLRVMSRTSSMAYKGTTKAVPEIARELGVDLILEGSVVRDEGRVRVTAQLIDAETDRHLWAKSYDRAVRDILSLQAEVATAIAKEVNIAISPRLAQRFPGRGSIDPATGGIVAAVAALNRAADQRLGIVPGLTVDPLLDPLR
jgi:TolB-like protein